MHTDTLDAVEPVAEAGKVVCHPAAAQPGGCVPAHGFEGGGSHALGVDRIEAAHGVAHDDHATGENTGAGGRDMR